MLLVTGATGHTGRFFVKNLIDNNFQGKIKFLIRKNSNTSFLDNSGLNFEKVVGDINDCQALDSIMSGVEEIVHIYNIRQSVDVIKLAIKNNVKKVVCVHTTGIYSKLKSSKVYQDIEDEIFKIIKSQVIKVVILRPTMIYGDLCDHNIKYLVKMVDKIPVLPIFNHGNSLIQPINARDLGKACYQVLKAPDEIIKTDYILSGDRPITIIEALKLISKELNKKTIYINFPLWFGVFGAYCLKIMSFNKINLVEKIQRIGEDRSYAHLDAQKDFGFKPEPFEEGIKREIKEYLQTKNFKA